MVSHSETDGTEKGSHFHHRFTLHILTVEMLVSVNKPAKQTGLVRYVVEDVVIVKCLCSITLCLKAEPRNVAYKDISYNLHCMSSARS